MTQFYIGCQQVEAWPQEKDGKPGYAVKYSDGYQSWSPQDVFERAYLPMGEGNDGSSITDEMIRDFVRDYDVETRGKTTIIFAVLANGFELVEAASCVDPSHYDQEVGRHVAEEILRDKVDFLLGFLLQTARYGITPRG